MKRGAPYPQHSYPAYKMSTHMRCKHIQHKISVKLLTTYLPTLIWFLEPIQYKKHENNFLNYKYLFPD